MLDIATRMDALIARRRLLDHDFYKAWAAGTLSRDDLAFYSTQYWRQVEAFPGYLETVAERLPESRAKKIVSANLSDERDDDHPGLWLRFANELGVEPDQVRGAPVDPETRACIANFASAVKDASVPFALGMLYGYESQTPAVAATKIDGLRDHYGIEGEPVEYFALHGELDITHSAEMADAIEDVAGTDDELRVAEAGAVAGATAISTLLDGVARARDVC